MGAVPDLSTGQNWPLAHSWPIYEATWRLPPSRDPKSRATGTWSCRLSDEVLCWSPAVYALFGIPVEERLTRSLTLSFYLPHSRSALETLRAHAIRHKRGFSLDARIRRPDGELRWMRLTAAPVLCEGRVIRLEGTKEDVTRVHEGNG